MARRHWPVAIDSRAIPDSAAAQLPEGRPAWSLPPAEAVPDRSSSEHHHRGRKARITRPLPSCSAGARISTTALRLLRNPERPSFACGLTTAGWTSASFGAAGLGADRISSGGRRTAAEEDFSAGNDDAVIRGAAPVTGDAPLVWRLGAHCRYEKPASAIRSPPSTYFQPRHAGASSS